MKLYMITQPVKARGHQYYETPARSPEEALERYRAGKLKCISQDLDVDMDGEPEIDERFKKS